MRVGGEGGFGIEALGGEVFEGSVRVQAADTFSKEVMVQGLHATGAQSLMLQAFLYTNPAQVSYGGILQKMHLAVPDFPAV